MTDRDESTDREYISNEGLTPVDKPFRERVRCKIGLSNRQWQYFISGVILLPYVLFVLLYSAIPEDLFLVLTLAYSLVAMYMSYKL